MTESRTFHSLRYRNFRLFFCGQLVSQAGTWLTMVAMTLLVLRRTDSGVAVGILVASQFLPMMLIGAWGGVIADRADKRRLLLITQSLALVQSVVLAILAFLPDSPLPLFYVTAFAGGILLAFDNPARRSFVAEMVPEDSVQNAVTLNSAIMTASRIVGPLLAGALVVTVGFGWCFAVDAASYLAVLGSLWLMRPADLRPSPRTPKAKGQIVAALKYLWAVPDLKIPLVMAAVIGALTFNFQVTLPLFVVHTLGGDDASYTVLYAVLSVGSLGGALAAARTRRIELRHVVWSALGFGVAMVLMTIAPTLATAFPAALFVGFASIAFLTTSTAIVQVRASPEMRGRVLAFQAMVFIGTTPIGGPILGVICDAFGARVGLAIGAVGALAAAGWAWLAVKKYHASLDDSAVLGPADAVAVSAAAAELELAEP